jgi:hypothetical protein
MRKVRKLIRLKYEARLSHEQIAGALAISKGMVAIAQQETPPEELWPQKESAPTLTRARASSKPLDNLAWTRAENNLRMRSKI